METTLKKYTNWLITGSILVPILNLMFIIYSFLFAGIELALSHAGDIYVAITMAWFIVIQLFYLFLGYFLLPKIKKSINASLSQDSFKVLKIALLTIPAIFVVFTFAYYIVWQFFWNRVFFPISIFYIFSLFLEPFIILVLVLLNFLKWKKLKIIS